MIKWNSPSTTFPPAPESIAYGAGDSLSLSLYARSQWLLSGEQDCVNGADTTDQREENLMAEGGAGINCTIEIEVNEDMEPPVFVYYELHNFYQNHRQYVPTLGSQHARGISLQNRFLFFSARCSRSTDGYGVMRARTVLSTHASRVLTKKVGLIPVRQRTLTP